MTQSRTDALGSSRHQPNAARRGHTQHWRRGREATHRDGGRSLRRTDSRTAGRVHGAGTRTRGCQWPASHPTTRTDRGAHRDPARRGAVHSLRRRPARTGRVGRTRAARTACRARPGHTNQTKGRGTTVPKGDTADVGPDGETRGRGGVGGKQARGAAGRHREPGRGAIVHERTGAGTRGAERAQTSDTDERGAQRAQANTSMTAGATAGVTAHQEQEPGSEGETWPSGRRQGPAANRSSPIARPYIKRAQGVQRRRDHKGGRTRTVSAGGCYAPDPSTRPGGKMTTIGGEQGGQKLEPKNMASLRGGEPPEKMTALSHMTRGGRAITRRPWSRKAQGSRNRTIYTNLR